MTRFATAFALLLSTPFAAQAQTTAEAPAAAILVMDGSGSMWGQIDGINKIVIARDVVADLLADLPPNLSLGLTAYGHRRRGDCSDIQTLIEPGLNNRDAIRDAVFAINPRGRTPMTQAVVEAARALRFTEEPATVILVSDGIETCEADPCAIAAELEAAGIAFTAHVVGFDVASEPEARQQMQCIAETTGGRFLTADNAEELAAALSEVAQVTAAPAPAVQPEPTPAAQPEVILNRVTFAAAEQIGDARRTLDEPVVYEVLAQGDIVVDATQAASTSVELPDGAYELRAMRLATEDSVTVPFEVSGGNGLVVEAVFVTALPPASLTAPASGSAGSTISVIWDGPNGNGDFLSTALPGSGALDSLTYAYTADGQPLPLRLPAQPGDYVIRYVMAEGGQVLAEVPVSVSAYDDALVAATTAPIGAIIPVEWSGAGHDDDYIDVAQIDADAGSYLSYAYVRDGNPVSLHLPVFPGRYVIRYITGQDTSVFASREIEVTDVPATLSAPNSASAGSTLSVAWTGPANPGDYVTIATPGDGALGYVTYAYLDGMTPVSIEVPQTAGTYELRYIADGPQARILVSQPIAVQ